VAGADGRFVQWLSFAQCAELSMGVFVIGLGERIDARPVNLSFHEVEHTKAEPVEPDPQFFSGFHSGKIGAGPFE
jgi:hypothetical protein